MRALILLPLIVLAGCSTRPSGVTTSEQAMLEPGPAYVAGFPEEERRAVCERLEYEAGTVGFERCMQGYFPENPAFADAGR